MKMHFIFSLFGILFILSIPVKFLRILWKIYEQKF